MAFDVRCFNGVTAICLHQLSARLGGDHGRQLLLEGNVAVIVAVMSAPEIFVHASAGPLLGMTRAIAELQLLHAPNLALLRVSDVC